MAGEGEARVEYVAEPAEGRRGLDGHAADEDSGRRRPGTPSDVEEACFALVDAHATAHLQSGDDLIDVLLEGRDEAGVRRSTHGEAVISVEEYSYRRRALQPQHPVHRRCEKRRADRRPLSHSAADRDPLRAAVPDPHKLLAPREPVLDCVDEVLRHSPVLQLAQDRAEGHPGEGRGAVQTQREETGRRGTTSGGLGRREEAQWG